MATFHFSPDGRRRGRQRYAGRLEEPRPEPIPLLPTPANLRILLEAGARMREPSYSHHAIARWCGDLALGEQRRFDRRVAENERMGNESGEIEAHVLEIAEAVDAQFDLYLFNSYSLDDLAALDPATVELPTAWFRDWLIALDAGPKRSEHGEVDV
jgi:hypothetical protein